MLEQVCLDLPILIVITETITVPRVLHLGIPGVMLDFNLVMVSTAQWGKTDVPGMILPELHLVEQFGTAMIRNVKDRATIIPHTLLVITISGTVP